MLFFKPIKAKKGAQPQVTKKPANKIRMPAKLDPRTALAEGTILDQYRFSKVIGRGSFSLVYQAIDMRTREKVVIKEYFPKLYAIRKKNAMDVVPAEGKKLMIFKQGFMQFFKEAIALNKVRHPNTLRTTDIIRANKTTYVVSKASGGQDLKRFLLGSKKPLDLHHIYKIFLPIMSSLNYLHSAELLHLDIKPANILLLPTGEPLLIDFGAAQAFSSSRRPGQIQTLTRGFAPPEQYDKRKRLGPWTDIYAVAATLSQCITGRSPAKTAGDGKPTRIDPDIYGEKYGRQLINSINRALSLDYKKRYETVDQFAQHFLRASPWATLNEYERLVMGYDRNRDLAHQSQHALSAALA